MAEEEEEYNGSHLAILVSMGRRLGNLERQAASTLEEQREAKISRRLMHEKLDEMRPRLNGVDSLKKIVDDLKTTVAEHEKLRQNIIGGVAVLLSLITVAAFGAGVVVKELWAWIISHLHWT